MFIRPGICHCKRAASCTLMWNSIPAISVSYVLLVFGVIRLTAEDQNSSRIHSVLFERLSHLDVRNNAFPYILVECVIRNFLLEIFIGRET